MIRNLKALGLMVVAALAVSAMFASAASAEGLKGTITTAPDTENHAPATLIGTEKEDLDPAWNFFESFKNKVECTHEGVKYTGTVKEGTATQITMTPEYKDCEATGERPVTVNTNGCQFIFTQPTTTVPTVNGEYTGKVDLTCPKDKFIAITVFFSGTHTEHSGGVACNVRVHATGGLTGPEGSEHTTQELGGHVIYQNIDPATGKHDLTVTATVTGISATRQGLCTFGAHGTENGGIFNSTVTLSAVDDEGPTHTDPYDVWISDQ